MAYRSSHDCCCILQCCPSPRQRQWPPDNHLRHRRWSVGWSRHRKGPPTHCRRYKPRGTFSRCHDIVVVGPTIILLPFQQAVQTPWSLAWAFPGSTARILSFWSHYWVCVKLYVEEFAAAPTVMCEPQGVNNRLASSYTAALNTPWSRHQITCAYWQQCTYVVQMPGHLRVHGASLRRN